MEQLFLRRLHKLPVLFRYLTHLLDDWPQVLDVRCGYCGLPTTMIWDFHGVEIRGSGGFTDKIVYVWPVDKVKSMLNNIDELKTELTKGLERHEQYITENKNATK